MFEKKKSLINCINESFISNEIMTLLSNVVVHDKHSAIPILTVRFLEMLSCLSGWLPVKHLEHLIDVMLSHVTSLGIEVVRLSSVNGLK